MRLFVSLILRPLRGDLLRTALTVFAVALGVGVVIAIDLAGDAATGSFESSLETVVGKVDLQILANGGLDERIMATLTGLHINARFCPLVEQGTVFGVDPFECASGEKQESTEGYTVMDIAEAQQKFHRLG